MLGKLGTRNVAGVVATVLVLGLAAAGVSARVQIGPSGAATVIPGPTAAPELQVNDLPAYTIGEVDPAGISRLSDVYTIIPTRPRLGLLKYQVQLGDTLFGISEKFGLKPESILWGNWYELGGDPHVLQPGQELSILPVDGALHRWAAGEGLNGVASFYGVTAQDILDWPGNDLNPSLDPAKPEIEEGAELIVPGGRRDPPSWQMIRITRSNPAVASILGPGACGAVSNGPIGDGLFGWPTPGQTVSGYGYIPGIHEAIDIGGGTGNAISATDDGVVVYAGWNDWGYGYTVVLDHGNGWQSLYAHLSQINVGCGQAAFQGNVIAGMGCTGNCSGTHLHFELRSDAFGRVNPLLFLP
jgi:murein DD-endopeptidase MepM/ murein hydrolase activator NlpD